VLTGAPALALALVTTLPSLSGWPPGWRCPRCNTRRVGAIVSGPIIAVGALTVLGERGIFVSGAALTLLALLVVGATARSRRIVGSLP
jgi:hypothetical protein